MEFLLVSQRAKSNPYYNLKDLPGHGRFDVVVRCILATTRKLASNTGNTIYSFLKGSTPHGWLKIVPEFVSEGDDEISLAAKIQNNWFELFTEGSLSELISLLSEPFQLLSEDGSESGVISGTIILGAQSDLTDADLDLFDISRTISLGKRSLLASHAIIYTRQLNL